VEVCEVGHLAQDRFEWRAVMNTGSIKVEEFPNKLSGYWLLKKDSAPWGYYYYYYYYYYY
jgi:hypothetical protein